MEEDHAAVIVEHEAEEAGALSGEAVHADDLEEEAEHVAHDHAAENVVERQQAEGRKNAQEADPFILLGQRGISADGALAGLTAYRQLAEHDDDADENDQEQIHNQEREAALLAHLVREAPDVAQADRGTDSSHQEAEVGAP